MTRKHFETIAISLGMQMRDYIPESNEWEVVLDTAAAIAADFRALNPRFDTDRFLTFALEVAEGTRDVDGKKIAA